MSFSISGTTKNLAGASAIQNVVVTAFNYPAGTSAGSATSDASGNWTISNLNAGDYTLTAVLAGWNFQTTVQVSSALVSQPAGVTIISANVTGVSFTATDTFIFSMAGSGFTQGGTNGSSVASINTGARTVAVGQAVIIAVRNGSGGGFPTSVTSNIGNTYTLSKSFTDSRGAQNAVYVSVIGTGGSETVTANFSPNTSFASISSWQLAGTKGQPGTFACVASDTADVASGTFVDSGTINTQVPLAFAVATIAGTSVQGTTGRSLLVSTLDSTNASYGRSAGHVALTAQTSGTFGINNSGTGTSMTLNTFVCGFLTNGVRGNCGVGSATVSFSGPRSGSVTADLAGNYYIPFTSVADIATWTITPSKSSITFSPTNNTVAVSALGSDATGPTFTGTTTITVAPSVLSKTDTTVTLTWTTSGACNSKAFATGGSYSNRPALDNSVPCAESTHVAIVDGLAPSTTYSFTVQSLDQVSSPINVTTNPAQARIMLSGVSAIGTSNAATSSTGDTFSGFVSNDGIEYTVRCDGVGFSGGTNANYGVDKISTLSPLTGTQVNALTGYGAFNTSDGQDNVTTVGNPSTKKSGGNPFGIAGNLLVFTARQSASPSFTEYRGGVLISSDKGVTWANWQNPGVFSAAAVEQNPVMTYMYGDPNIGWASPVRYAADDGTLGYATAGNGVDGGNGWVYHVLFSLVGAYGMTLARSRRRAYIPLLSAWQSLTPYTIAFQYWVGPASPTAQQFVTDSNWSDTFSGTTTIYTSAVFFRPHMTFIPTLKSYILGGGGSGNNIVFAAAPTPAGPWTTFYNGANPSSISDLNEPVPLHSDVIANVATQNLAIRLMHSAAPGANYQLRLSSGTTFTTSAFNITGNVGGGGVTVNYSGTASGTVIADALGNYIIPALANGSYTVTPTGGYIFSPTSSNQTVNNANVTGVNFTATVTGTAGIQAYRDFLNKRGLDDNETN